MREKRQRIIKDSNLGSKGTDSSYGKRTFKKGDNTPPPSRESKPRNEGSSFSKEERPRYDSNSSTKREYKPRTEGGGFRNEERPKFDSSSSYKREYKPRNNSDAYGNSERPKFDKTSAPFSKEFKPKFDRNTNSDEGANYRKPSSFEKNSKAPFVSRRSAAPTEKSFSNFFKDDDYKDTKAPNGRNWTYKERKKDGNEKSSFSESADKKSFKSYKENSNLRQERTGSGFKTPYNSVKAPKDNLDKFDDKFDYDNYKGSDSDDSFKSKKPYDSKRGSSFGDKRAYSPKPYSKRVPTDNILSKQHDDGLVRLNKYISNAGICSRREADELIQTGVIKVNGKVITDLGVRISPTDIVLMEGQKISQEKKVYILVNKPKDFITTVEDPQDRKTVMNLVKDACRERVYPVGRLDRNTTGVLLLTNDGELTKKLTHPKYEKSKMYHVFLDKPLTKAHFELIEQGIELEDGFVKVDAIDYVAKAQNFDEVGVELHSGRNRIVRRIFESLDYRVLKLDRVMFAGLTKKDLPRGRWRFLTQAEISMLYGN